MPAGMPRASMIGADGLRRGVRTEVGALGVISVGDDMTDEEADMLDGEPGVELPPPDLVKLRSL